MPTEEWADDYDPHSREARLERAARYERAGREADRKALWDFARFAAEVTVATGLGLLLLGMALHVAEVELGHVYWWGGMVTWLAGLATAIARARTRAEHRGDLGSPV